MRKTSNEKNVRFIALLNEAAMRQKNKMIIVSNNSPT